MKFEDYWSHAMESKETGPELFKMRRLLQGLTAPNLIGASMNQLREVARATWVAAQGQSSAINEPQTQPDDYPSVSTDPLPELPDDADEEITPVF